MPHAASRLPVAARGFLAGGDGGQRVGQQRAPPRRLGQRHERQAARAVADRAEHDGQRAPAALAAQPADQADEVAAAGIVSSGSSTWRPVVTGRSYPVPATASSRSPRTRTGDRDRLDACSSASLSGRCGSTCRVWPPTRAASCRGSQLAARFAAIDRLVAFLRVLSAEQSLDDLQPGLAHRLRAGRRGDARGHRVLAGRVARAGRRRRRARGAPRGRAVLHGRRQPLRPVPRRARAARVRRHGAVATSPGDFVLYGAEQDVAYRIESELPLSRLLLRLSLVRRPAAAAAGGGVGSELPGRRAAARHGAPRAGPRWSPVPAPRASSACAAPDGRAGCARPRRCARRRRRARSARRRSFWLFRVERAPARMRGLLTKTPGLELFAPVTDNVGRRRRLPPPHPPRGVPGQLPRRSAARCSRRAA